METRVRTLLVMTTREGRRWGIALWCPEVPIPADGDTSDEGLPASDDSESDDSAKDASFAEGWSSDNDQRGDDAGENPTVLALPVATLNRLPAEEDGSAGQCS